MIRLALLATYPILPAAKTWLRDEGPGLDDLLTDFVYNRARDRARARVAATLSGDELADEVLLSDVDAEMELLSHPLARVLVSAVDEPLLARRYAVAESKRLSRALDRDAGETVAAVAEALGIPFRRRDGDKGKPTFGLAFPDFLRHAPHEKSWHLSRRDPEAGYVWLDKQDFSRLLEEVYKRRLETELVGRAHEVPDAVHEIFKTEIERMSEQAAALAARFARADLTTVAPTLFPPCMKRILQDMHDHRNVPHMGRFAIVSFLHTLGMKSEEILKFFSSVPDFDVEKSRYQIEHITGKGGPTSYTPPSCETMQTYGVCPLEERDAICHSVRHPLSYYRKALARAPPEAAAAAPNATPPADLALPAAAQTGSVPP